MYEPRRHDYQRFRLLVHKIGNEKTLEHIQHRWMELTQEIRRREPHSLYNFINKDLKAEWYMRAIEVR